MKQSILIIFFLIASFTVKSQSVNIITSDEFDAVTINKTTLLNLKKTNGKQSKVEGLLGASTFYEATEFFYHFKFDGLKLDFSNMENQPFIESFEILNNKVVLTIKNIAITIGDNISKLGEVNFSKGRNGSKSILYSTCEDCDIMINIEFDQTTNIITKISYFDMS